MNYIQASDRQRVLQDLAREQLGGSIENVYRKPLLLFMPFDQEKSSYELPFTKSQNSDYAIEQKLAENDSFYVTDMAALVTQFDVRNPNGTIGNYPKAAYVDPRTHTDADEQKALLAFFHGTHGFNTGQSNTTENVTNLLLLKAPEAQITDLVVGAGAATHPAMFDLDSVLTPVGPHMLFAGGNENKLVVKMGPGARTNIAGTDTNIKNGVLFILDGYVRIGGSADLARRINSQAKSCAVN